MIILNIALNYSRNFTKKINTIQKKSNFNMFHSLLVEMSCESDNKVILSFERKFTPTPKITKDVLVPY